MGTRISVELVIDLLTSSWTEADIVRNYPDRTSDDMRACLKYASEMLHSERVYLTPA